MSKEKKLLDDIVGSFNKLTSGINDAAELFELSMAEEDWDTVEAVGQDVEEIEKEVAQLEFKRMFNQPMDSANCYLEIQAGAGGTEAQDWASMLERMYMRYAERKGFKVTLEEESPGEVAGIKSCTLYIEGEWAYGTLRTETGIHRLVRKSPFDSNARRHTSFTSVYVYPEVDDSIEIEINPADLSVDVFRASGAGGQHIQKTSRRRGQSVPDCPVPSSGGCGIDCKPAKIRGHAISPLFTRAHLCTVAGAVRASSQSPLCSVPALRRKLHTLPCSSFPHKNRSAGFLWGPHIRALRTSSAMGSYAPQTPCALCAARHPLCVCLAPQSLLSPH